MISYWGEGPFSVFVSQDNIVTIAPLIAIPNT